MVIQSLNMNQYPFRPWDDNLSAIKALMYLAYRNRHDIASTDTCYSLKLRNFYNTERWESKRISIDIYGKKDLDLLLYELRYDHSWV